MGANSGAREVAGERLLLEKEKLSGLRPAAYAAAKLTHVGALSVFQGLWMLGFVKLVWTPDQEEVWGAYQVVARGEHFTITGTCDVDGDGERATFTATEADPAAMATDAGVF